MDVLIISLITGAIGLTLGIAGILAFRMSENSWSSAALRSDDELPDGIAEVLAVLPSAAIVIDAGDDVTKASPAAYTFGLVRGHVLAAQEIQEAVARVRVRGLIEEIDFETQRGSDESTRRYLHARVAPLAEAYVLVLCDDQTESHRINAVRRDFVANVSHELKTPIGAISLLAEAVTDFSDDPEAVQRFGGKLQKESVRLTQLVQEIINLSRVQDNEELESTATVDLEDVVSEAVDRAKTNAEAKSIIVSTSCESGVKVQGSFDLLVNAVRNLVDNAVNYSNSGTAVGVSVESHGSEAEIVVTDHGIGMTPDESERIFERFYRVDPARSRNTGGTGLGLSIVKHIVATHGGRIDVWSRPGEGSTFTITLPAAPADNVRLLKPTEDTTSDGQPAGGMERKA